ncbi:MAG TPA: hypothetical protein P5572_00345 [Phycisphaerae bacterium]|nr:hypothetical protein [Phycisphaerales bacterium]HRX83447.1 hypothetical protein [Phycisphaerae bacterium]
MTMRLLCGGIILFWTAATAWLIQHDILPQFTAQDMPLYAVKDWANEPIRKTQARIEDKTGRRIGTVWSTHTASPTGLSREDVFFLEHVSMLPMLRIEVHSDFTAEGTLDTFNLKLYGASEHIELQGEEYSGNLAFRLMVGAREQLFKVDASAAGMVSDVFRPFPTLPKIAVGQSWRMHVVNPLAAISGIGTKLIPMIVTVKGRERLPTASGPVDCYIVATDHGARAWVGPDGNVLRQEVDAPIGGHLVIVDEPFDQQRLDQVMDLPLPSGILD